MPYRLDPDDAFLVFIDVQTRLWGFMHDRERVGPRMAQLVEGAGLLGWPIVVTEQYPRGLGPTLPNLKALLDRFDAYRPIEKSAFSCFGEPAFLRAVEAIGRKTLVVAGIETHVCVLQTVLDALDGGFSVHLVSEATSSRWAENRTAGIERMRHAGAVISSVEMVLFEAMQTSGHPRFREIQKVIM